MRALGAIQILERKINSSDVNDYYNRRVCWASFMYVLYNNTLNTINYSSNSFRFFAIFSVAVVIQLTVVKDEVQGVNA